MLNNKLPNLEFYKNDWKDFFLQEKNKISTLLKANLIEVHHIGSTAIKNILSKPKIDMAVIVTDLKKSLILENLEYKFKGEFNIPFRFFFSKTEEIGYNLHVMLPQNHELEGFIAFRDFMNSHPLACKEYSETKKKLEHLLDSPKAKQPLNKYTLGKDKIIRKFINESGFKNFCMRFVTHYREQEFEKDICNKYGINIHPENIRVILYKGAEIIGYALATEETIIFLQSTENKEKFFQYFQKYLNFKKTLNDSLT